MIRKKIRLMTSAAALLAVLAALLVAITLMSTKSAAENVFEFVTGVDASGNLTKESKPYTAIRTYEEFQKINESDESLAGNYVLENDITLPSGWDSIGSGKPFTGCFEGKGHTITIGADAAGTNTNLVPFFKNSGVIHDLNVTGTVSVKTYFGSVVSSNGSGGYVIDCSSKADITVTGKGMVGGIVGVNEGTVYRCRFTGTLATETMNGVSYYGGIIGSNLGTVDSCANYGSIRGCVNVGGIAGQNYENGTVKDCLNAGDISANAEDAGGITGRNFGTISSSFTSGNVTLAAYSNSTGYGGICAYNSGAITGTYYDRGQFPGDGIGDGDKVDYTCEVYPWEINGMEIDGWGSAQVTNDSGDTSKKRTTEYSLPYPNGASTANKTSSLFRFETKDGSAWKSYTSITTADELKAISNNLDGSYVLENDITLSGDWVTTKEPTYTSTGVKTKTCSICGAAEEDTIPKKSGISYGGSSGGGSSRPSGGSSSTSDSKPSINGKQKSWSDISSDIAKLPAGGSATINTNGETNVPADVIKSIKDSKAKVELIIDSTRSWIIDGLRISKVSAADLSTLPGNADRSTLRGTSGADLKITGTRVPADLKLKFRKEFAGQFANLYKLTDGKLVFQNCVKVDENGAVIIPGADTNGEYIVMVCEFSDRLGDMNNDGVLNALDASAILKSIIGAANGANPQMADFNGDGKVNAFDASAILKWIIAA